jgi:hypothetical protein
MAIDSLPDVTPEEVMKIVFFFASIVATGLGIFEIYIGSERNSFSLLGVGENIWAGIFHIGTGLVFIYLYFNPVWRELQTE